MQNNSYPPVSEAIVHQMSREKEITNWFLTKGMLRYDYNITEDSTVDVAHGVSFKQMNIWDIPFKFNNVNGFFNVSHNQLSSITMLPTTSKLYISCAYNKITNLHNIHKIVRQMSGKFYCTGNPIKSHMLGLCLVRGLESVEFDNGPIDNIINKYLHDINLCQEALIDAGFADYGQM